MASYSELRTLTVHGIGGKHLPGAVAYLSNAGLQAVDPNRNSDNHLLTASIESDEPEPLLCLRCHISHPLEAWMRVLYGRFKDNYDLDLTAIASYGLDDIGSDQLRIARDQSTKPFSHSALAELPSGMVSPFSAEVLRTYDSSRCGLPHWARQKIQCHNELKAYLRQQGLLLISDWALLADTSPTRIRDSWESCGDDGVPLTQLLALHQRYKPLYREAMAAYRQRTGKGSGWQPDQHFLQALNPEQRVDETMLQLKAMADAVRQLLSGRWLSTLDAAETNWEPADPASLATEESEVDGQDDRELRHQIDIALNRAIEALMPMEMEKEAKKFAKAPERRRAWQLYGEGMSQREIGPACDHQQAWVSKLLDEKRRSTAIATAAAQELKRLPAFSSLMATVEGTEQLVDALRNHLIEPEREGADARLWHPDVGSQLPGGEN